MRLTYYILILGFIGQLSAQQTFEPGKVIDSIPVSKTTNETFALYLPTSYEASKASPILFIYEPGGRGRLGIQTFIEASEAYGHILVCSNNSKNGPYERNFAIASNLFDHVFSRFNIDGRQLYLAGFSGGSRLAWTIASMAENIAGVIACGAGMSESKSPILVRQEFAYAAICGDRDMNYKEMLDVVDYLGRTGQDLTLITFQGGHSWPPASEIMQAFDWLALQAHQKGTITIPENKLYQSLERNYAIAKNLETKGNLLGAVENYERVLSSYNDFYKLDSVMTNLEDLKKGSLYKRALKARKAAVAKEKELTGTLLDRFINEFNHLKKIDLPWWEKKLNQLKEKYSGSGDEYELMLDRVLNYLYAMAYSRTNPNLYQASEAQKNFCNALCKLVYPKHVVKQ